MTILHGDCVRLMADMPDSTADLVIADPPYGMDYRSSRRNTPFAPIIGDRTFNPAFHHAWLTETHRLLKPNTHLYVFCSDHHIGRFRDTIADVGFTLKRTLIWLKRGGGMGDLAGDYAPSAEYIVFAHKGRRTLNGRRDPNVLEYRRVPPKRMIHPTEKPVELLRYLIRKSTTIGETLLDPFAGSAPAGAAAMLERRNYIGIELDAAHIPVARERAGSG